LMLHLLAQDDQHPALRELSDNNEASHKCFLLLKTHQYVDTRATKAIHSSVVNHLPSKICV